jgi:prepilin-type N-terminal cleavage/methylation domain-containing protein/prepilin-type processing-associated H-X9-DG protein
MHHERKAAAAQLSAAVSPSPSSGRATERAFTLIELLVTIAIIAILASLLLPGLAGAKARSQRLKCTSQMKQLGLGLTLFTTDHDEMYPPTAYATGDYQYQLAWDDYIHRLIGGNAPDADLIVGISGGIADRSTIPKLLKCPADRIQITISWAVFGQRRTYAMNYAGPEFQVATKNGRLPRPTHGVGVYYNLRGSAPGSLPEWDPQGFKETVVQDPAGTLLLVEQPAGGNIAGNDWPSFSMGPTGPSQGDQTPFQIAIGGRQKWGAAAYGLHGRRFNYLFHDGHVAIHKITDTVGAGTTNSPKGMWTMIAGD